MLFITIKSNKKSFFNIFLRCLNIILKMLLILYSSETCTHHLSACFSFHQERNKYGNSH